MPNEGIICLELYKETGLESRIEKYQSEAIYGDELEALLKRILDLTDADGKRALVEDRHTTCLTQLSSLLRNHPLEDASVRSMIQDVLNKCAPPYVFEKANRLEIASGLADLIRMCIEKIRQWSAFDEAEKLLQELHSSYMDPFKRDEHSNRISITILSEAKCYHIDLAIAMEMLSLDEGGNRVRKISTGQRVVAAFGGAHWKPNTCFPIPPAPLQPGMEHAVYTWMKLIVGPRIFVAAPAVPISIHGRLPISSPLSPRSSSPRNEPTQYALSGDVIQVSLTVEGVCFKDYLILLDTLRAWEKVLSPKELKWVMEDAKNGFTDIIEYTSEIFPNILTKMSEEDRFELLCLVSKNLEKDADVDQVLLDIMEYKKIFPDILKEMNNKDRFECLRLIIENLTEFIDVLGNQNRAKDSRQRVFYEALEWYINEGGKIEDVYVLIGLISKFPRLSNGRTMIGHVLVNKTAMGLLFDIKSTRFLFEKVFPDIPAITACQWAKELLTKLDDKTTSALFVAFSLVPPGDAKSDNWILQITYNEAGVISCHIAAIDIGYSLAMPFRLVRNSEVEKLCLTIKNILFLIPEILKRPLHPDVREQILNTSVEHQIITGLCMLALRDSYDWINFNKKLNAIDIPVSLSPQVIFFLQKQWKQLQQIVGENQNITHEELLEKLSPAVLVSHQGVPRFAVYQAALIENTVREHKAKEMLRQLRTKEGLTPQELQDNEWLWAQISQMKVGQELSAQQVIEVHKRLTEKPPSNIENEAAYCDLGNLRDISRLVGPKEKNSSLFDKANRQCEYSENEAFKDVNKRFLEAYGKPPEVPQKDLTAITLCLAIFRHDIKWKRLSSEIAWEYVKIFCILPPHLLTAQMWTDVMSKEYKEDEGSLFQFWLRMAILNGAPLVALRMLQLGAKPNVADPHKQRTALHEFCDNCLQYSKLKDAQLMAELLLTHPNCEPDRYSIEGPPLFILIRAVLLNLAQWNETKKSIFIDVLDHFARLGNLEAKNTQNQTVLDEVLETILNSNALEHEQAIKIWLFSELVKRDAGIHANGKRLYEAYHRLDSKDLKAAIDILKERNLSLDWQFSLTLLRIKSVYMVTASGLQKDDEDSYSAEQKDSIHITRNDDRDILVSSLASGEICFSKRLYDMILKNKELDWFSFRIGEDTWYVINLCYHRDVGRGLIAQCGGELLFASTVPGDYFYISKEINRHGFVWISKMYPGMDLKSILEKKQDIAAPVSRKSFRESFRESSAGQSKFFFQKSFRSTTNLYNPEVSIPVQPKEFNLELDCDSKSFSAQIIAHLILGWDACPADFIRKDFTGVLKIMNHGSLPEPLEVENSKTSIFCYLFYLTAVYKEVHPAIREGILSKEPEFFLKTLLLQLKVFHERINKLGENKEYAQSSAYTSPFLPSDIYCTELPTSEEDAQSSENTAPFLLSGIYCSEQFIRSFLNRFHKIRSELQNNPSATHMQCIYAADPISAAAIEKAFHQDSKPGAISASIRFDMMQHSKRNKESTTKQLLDPENAMKKLIEISKKKVSVDYHLDLLRKGITGRLQDIKREVILEELFNRFFGDESYVADAGAINAILKIFVNLKINFQKIIMRNCAIAITDREFRNLLSASTNLTTLHVSGCQELSNEIFSIICERADSLRDIALRNLPGVTICNLKLNQLEKCSITGNLNLKEVDVNAPRVVEVDLSSNRGLVALRLNSKHLKSLNVSDCFKLTNAALTRAITRYIPYLKINGCTEIDSPLLRYYANISHSSSRTRVDANGLEEQIEQLEHWMNLPFVDIDSSKFKNVELLIIVISILLKEHSGLTVLIVNFSQASNEVRNKMILSLADGVKNNTTLRKLKVVDTLNPVQADELNLALRKNQTLYEVRMVIAELNEPQKPERLRVEVIEGDASISSTKMKRVVLRDATSFFETHSNMKCLEYNGRDLVKIYKELSRLKKDFILRFCSSRYMTTGPAFIMQDSDMPIIASFLTEDTTTTVLSFAGIPLSSGSIRILFEILEANDTVEVLDLHGCKLTEHDIELLLGLLKKNLRLRCVNLDLSDISESIAKRVSDILAKRDTTILSMNVFKYFQEMNSTEELRQVHSVNECLSWEDAALTLYRRGNRKNISWFVPSSDPSGKMILVGDLFLGTLEGHSQAVSAVLFLSNEHIATGSWDYTIRIWSLNTRECLYILEGHEDKINALLLLGDIIVSASADKTIKLWSCSDDSGKYICIRTLEGHEASVTAIIQHGPDHIITSSVDGIMKIWNITIFRESPFQRSYEHESLRVNDTIVDKTAARTMVKISAQKLAAGCSNGSIQIWDLKKKKCIHILKGHTAAILALIQLHTAGGKKYLISGSEDGTIRIWGCGKEGYIELHSIKTAPILTLHPLPFAEGFISADKNGNVKGWWPKRIADTKRIETDIMYHCQPLMWQAGISSDNFVTAITQSHTGIIAFGFADHKIKIFKDVFSQESSFDISFAEEWGESVSVTRTKSVVIVTFQNGLYKDDLCSKTQQLRDFLIVLFYNCHGKNNLSYSMQPTILDKENSLHIECPNRKNAFQIYNILFALFKKQYTFTKFLERISVEDAKKSSVHAARSVSPSVLRRFEHPVDLSLSNSRSTQLPPFFLGREERSQSVIQRQFLPLGSSSIEKSCTLLEFFGFPQPLSSSSEDLSKLPHASLASSGMQSQLISSSSSSNPLAKNQPPSSSEDLSKLPQASLASSGMQSQLSSSSSSSPLARNWLLKKVSTGSVELEGTRRKGSRSVIGQKKPQERLSPQDAPNKRF